MTTKQDGAALPSLRDVDAAIGALAQLFDALPRDDRARHAGDRREVLRVLEALRRYLLALDGDGASPPRRADAPRSEASEDDRMPTTPETSTMSSSEKRVPLDDEPPTKAELAKVDEILALLRELSPRVREALFDVLPEHFHVVCGHAYDASTAEDEEVHVESCPYESSEDEEDDGDEDEA